MYQLCGTKFPHISSISFKQPTPSHPLQGLRMAVVNESDFIGFTIYPEVNEVKHSYYTLYCYLQASSALPPTVLHPSVYWTNTQKICPQLSMPFPIPCETFTRPLRLTLKIISLLKLSLNPAKRVDAPLFWATSVPHTHHHYGLISPCFNFHLSLSHHFFALHQETWLPLTLWPEPCFIGSLVLQYLLFVLSLPLWCPRCPTPEPRALHMPGRL
jgi:hypothetical protein